jgi:hypothetical protein
LGEIHDCDVLVPMIESHGGAKTAVDHFRARREALYRRLMRDLGGNRWAAFRRGVETMAQAGT